MTLLVVAGLLEPRAKVESKERALSRISRLQLPVRCPPHAPLPATLEPINGIRDDDHDDKQKELWQLQRVLALFELIESFHDPVALPQQNAVEPNNLILFLPALDIRCRFGGPRLDDAGIDFRPPPQSP